MELPHPLKSLLQVQLASDASAVQHLPYTLNALAPSHLAPSAHTSKWTSRVNALIHARDMGARWAGLCLAYATASHSKALLLECAQSWVGAAMPLLVVRFLDESALLYTLSNMNAMC